MKSNPICAYRCLRWFSTRIWYSLSEDTVYTERFKTYKTIQGTSYKMKSKNSWSMIVWYSPANSSFDLPPCCAAFDFGLRYANCVWSTLKVFLAVLGSGWKIIRKKLFNSQFRRCSPLWCTQCNPQADHTEAHFQQIVELPWGVLKSGRIPRNWFLRDVAIPSKSQLVQISETIDISKTHPKFFLRCAGHLHFLLLFGNLFLWKDKISDNEPENVIKYYITGQYLQTYLFSLHFWRKSSYTLRKITTPKRENSSSLEMRLI